MRYSTASPESAGKSGGLSNSCRSSQRSATSRAEIVCSGRGLMLNPPRPREKTRSACGLEMRKGAVTPASLRTLTRNVRQPCSTSSALARPCVTWTRLSGLIWTSRRQWRSRISWTREVAARSSGSAIAASSARRSVSGSGDPRYWSASVTRATWAASGCNATATGVEGAGDARSAIIDELAASAST